MEEEAHVHICEKCYNPIAKGEEVVVRPSEIDGQTEFAYWHAEHYSGQRVLGKGVS